MVPYMSTGLAGCSVGPGISRGARKLARTPRIIKKKNSDVASPLILFYFLLYFFIFIL